MPHPPDCLFNQPLQRANYFEWMQANPHGFVLNWPFTGRNANGNLMFHRSLCRVLLQRSFPTPTYHKVCMRSLRDLTQWAEQNRRFPVAPNNHACTECFREGIEEFDRALNEEDEIPLIAIDQEPPARIETQVLRIVRDTALACRIKKLHGWRCQLCEGAIRLYNGRYYAEAHHLRPLGGDHRGLDIEGNIVCLCPTCHAKLDYGVISLSIEELTQVPDHRVDPVFIEYHNQHVYRAPIG